MLWFLIGLLAGALPVAVVWWRERRRAERLDEEKQVVSQEKDIVVEFMHDMVRAVGEGLARDELFQRIVHAAVVSTGALSACVFERNEQVLRGVAVEGLFPPHRPVPASHPKLASRARFIEQVLKSESFAVGEGIVGRCAATREAVLIERADLDPAVVKHEDPALAVKSVIAAPIVFRDEVLGVLAVANPADGLPFNQTDLSLVQSLAEQSALALHNASLIRQSLEKKQLDLDLALASSVQSMLLPRSFPQVPGFEVDAYFRPAQKLGGDLYECFLLPDGRLALSIADVSGKGIAASIVMAIGRTNLRRVADRHASPAAALAEVNRLMQADMREGMYITMILAYLDPATGETVLARAGHERPIVGHAAHDGQPAATEMPAGEGMPVGMVEPEVFEAVLADETLHLAPGDVVCFYTDGVTEAVREESEFGSARLAELVLTAGGRGARAVNEAIVESVQRFAGTEGVRDDMTLLTVARLH